MKMKIKILYRKNLKMSPGKLAAQSVHAALGLLWEVEGVDARTSVVVLSVSDAKFKEAAEKNDPVYVVQDAGYTEIPAGTETCVAFLEEDTPMKKSYALDKDDPNIPILIRDGWVLQPDGSWLSKDKQSSFSRMEDGRRMLATLPPDRTRRIRFAPEIK